MQDQESGVVCRFEVEVRVEESGSSAKGYSKEKVRLGCNSARRLRRAEDFLRLQS